MIKSWIKRNMAGNNCGYNVQPQRIEDQLSQVLEGNLPDAIVSHSSDSSGSDSFSPSNYPINTNVPKSEGDSGASAKCLGSSVISNYEESTVASQPVNVQLSDYVSVFDQASSSNKASSECLIFPTEYNIFSGYFNIDSSEEIMDVIEVDKKSDLNTEIEVINIVDSDEDYVKFIPVTYEEPAIESSNNECYMMGRNLENISNSNKIFSTIEDKISKNINLVDLTEDNHMEINVNNSSKYTRMNILLDILPDADLEFLKMKVNEINTDVDFHAFVETSLDLQNYPKKVVNRNIVTRNIYEFKSGNPTMRKSVIESINFSTESSSTSLAEPSLPLRTVAAIDNTSSWSAIYDVSHRSAHVDTAPPNSYDHMVYPPHSLYNLSQNITAPTIFNMPHTVTSCSNSDFTTSPVYPVVDLMSRSTQSRATDPQRHAAVSSTQTDGANHINVNFPSTRMINHLSQSTLNNHLNHFMHGIPETDYLHQDPYVWFPSAFQSTMALPDARRRRRQDFLMRRLNIMGRRGSYPISVNTIRAVFEGMGAMSNVSNQKCSANPPTIQDERFLLLVDILRGADRKILWKEVEKFKNDEDVAKFLVKAIINKEMWSKPKVCNLNVHFPKTHNSIKSKYKLLLELFPDASPSFLKMESVKLKTDEEMHEFAMKLSRDEKYPKCKDVGTNLRKKKNEGKEPKDQETIDPNYKTLLEMLPDADPDFLLQHSKSLANDNLLQLFVLKAVEQNSYPKRDQYLERQEYQKQWKKYIEHFDIKEYLQVIPNPVKYFYVDKKKLKTPFDISLEFIHHRYRGKIRQFGSSYIWRRDSLTKTCDHLDRILGIKPIKYRVWNHKTVFSTAVLQEIAFIQNKKEIAHFMLLRDEIKLIAYEKAKSEGALQECECCCEEKQPEDMSSCTGGHIYCYVCIKRGSEVVIGNGGTTFPCYSYECKEEFSLTVLKKVLNAEIFSRMITRKQYAEVNAAGIPGLETCSFCEFCSIPPPEDKLFYCLNPSCMKITCRNCKKIDHLPLSCEEFEKKITQQKMQSYVEDRMTEALVRTCWQCGTKFVKEGGCNMMKCKCGAQMCYFCRKPIKDGNYCDNMKCRQLLDTTAHDEKIVLNVGKKAKLEMEVANPGFQLSNDPTELLNHNRRRADLHHHRPHYYIHPNHPYFGH